ncbi:MAG: hypothetical protein M0R46_01245 [Candidatus Muirbacterium halophilum]|nr:hypothetical protein [Candidatus Muirbacterium halophilum]
MKKLFFLAFLVYIINIHIQAEDVKKFLVNYSSVSLSDEDFFDIIITEENLIPKNRNKKWLSYYSIGESINEIHGITEKVINESWNSFVIDNSKEKLIEYHIKNIKEKLENSDGIFLDNIDSYYFFEKHPFTRSIDNIKIVLEKIKKEFPKKLIIINRGFEGIDNFAPYINGILIENLYNLYDFKNKKIIKNPEEKQTLNIINNIKKNHSLINIFLIEYFETKTLKNPIDIDYTKYSFLDIKPYFSDISLEHTWILNNKIKNRFLVLNNQKNAWFNDVNKYLQIYFEYFGYVLDYLNVNDNTLPDDITKYSGLIIWNKGDEIYNSKFVYNILKRFNNKKIIYIGDLNENILDENILKNIKYHNFLIDKELNITKKSEYIGFEFSNDNYFVSGAIKEHPYKDIVSTSEGSLGYMSEDRLIMLFEPITQIGEDDFLWNINPFLLFEDFLKPDFPALDISSISGKRIGFSHLDADGFNSDCLIYPQKSCLEIMHEEITLKNPLINFSYSIITGFLEKKTEKKAEFFIDYIKNLSDSNIEIASHSYSHPFFMLEGRSNKEHGHNIDIEGYDKIDFEKEILGSINTLKQISDKTVYNYFLTGDCLPTEYFLDIAYKNNIYTINGGDPIFDTEHNSYSYLKPSYSQVGKYKQIYAQSQNEFIFTNGWEENFYNFKNVIETYKNTGSPFLLKPVDLYFHFYVVEKIPGLKALQTIIEELNKMNLCFIFTSDYLDIINSYFNTEIEKKDKNTFIITNSKVRSFKNFTDKKIDFIKSQNIIGKNIINNTEYIFTGNSEKTVLVFNEKKHIYNVILKECNKIIDNININENEKTIFLKTPKKYSHIPIKAIFNIDLGIVENHLVEKYKVYENNILIGNLKKIKSGEYEIF